MEDILQEARKLNEEKYSKVIDFYGVCYISDYCINDCLYCGDRKSNKKERCRLSLKEFEKDLQGILDIGHRTICFLTGQDKSLTTDRLIDYLKIAENKRLEEIILNIPPKPIEEFKRIRKAISNTPLQFRVFQETYNRKIYREQHLIGPKSDYYWRIESQTRALQVGFDTVGIGSLFGLNPNNDEEINELIKHANKLHKQFGKWPSTISIPRIQKAEGNKVYKIPASVNDKDYISYNAQLRLALPETKIIITSRETPKMKKQLRPYINIEDLEVKPGPKGNYLLNVSFQNEVQDKRNAGEILREIREQGFTPNFKIRKYLISLLG
ncbi:MAG: hypothetical protein KJ949_02810 [Nanoarchaeota archaeon]|nr:hypothetical protein [Nanoarchaeota archaeon]